ncbi:MAG TPA: hypothetical protein VGB18_08840 [Candidatus Thermoplasmatota archaeon]
MKRKITIQDPDFGRIELPDIAPTGQAEWNRMRARIRKKLVEKIVFQVGTGYPCPDCGQKELRAAEDLSMEIVRGATVVMVVNLHGARCRRCGTEILEPRETLRLDAIAGVASEPDEIVRVTTIGRGTLGTYWPKDVERKMDLKPGTRLTLRYLSRSSALLRVSRDGTRSPSRRDPSSKPSRGVPVKK